MRGGASLMGYNAATVALVAVSLGTRPEDWWKSATRSVIFSSSTNVLVAANAIFAALLNLALVLKAVFFGALGNQERGRLLSRCVDFALLKIVFIAAVASTDAAEVFVWTAWFAVIGFVKLFGGLARDRFDQLGQTPSATRFDHLRNALFVVILLAVNAALALRLSAITRSESTSKRVLLLYDPLTIALDLGYTLVKSSLNVADRWRLASSGDRRHGASWQWVAPFLYYADFATSMLNHCLHLMHHCHVWYLHGFSFQVVDSIILLNIRSLLGAMYKKVKTFAAFHCATSNLKKAFPGATKEEIEKYEDVCAICKEPMTQGAKVLPCGHIFHLPCLRSWLEQGEHGNYTCPLCRFPLTNTGVKEPPNRVWVYLVATYEHLHRHAEGVFLRMVDYLWQVGVGGHQGQELVGGERQGGGARQRERERGGSGRHGSLGGGVRPLGDHRHHHQHGVPPLWVLDHQQSSNGFTFAQSWGWFTSAGGGGGSRGSRGEGLRPAPLSSTSGDSELEGWTQIVASILPHVSRTVIVRDLQRTRNVNITVNNLLG